MLKTSRCLVWLGTIDLFRVGFFDHLKSKLETAVVNFLKVDTLRTSKSRKPEKVSIKVGGRRNALPLAFGPDNIVSRISVKLFQTYPYNKRLFSS